MTPFPSFPQGGGRGMESVYENGVFIERQRGEVRCNASPSPVRASGADDAIT